MNIDLTRLNNDIDKSIDVNIDYKFNKDELEGTDLLECDTHVEGKIYKNSLKQIMLDLSIEGDMIIPCAITLKPTKYPYKTEIKGSLIEFLNENDDFFTNLLDIFPIIWENILMEIPMRVVSPEAQDLEIKGDGWRLVTDDETTSSPLAELEDLIKEGR